MISPNQSFITACKQLLEEKVFSSKHPGDFHIGYEIEFFAVRTQSDEMVLVIFSELQDALLRMHEERVGDFWSSASRANMIQDQLYSLQINENLAIFFEPGGQLELVTHPAENLHALQRMMQAFYAFQSELLRSHGITLFSCGVHPWFTPLQIGLQLQRARYQSLSAYFSSFSETGLAMMYQTCSVQINLDYGKSDETMVRRLFVCELISPLCAAIFANTPAFANKKPGQRIFIWNHLDATRTGFWLSDGDPDKLRKTDLVDRWWKFASLAPMVHQNHNAEKIPFHAITFEQWLNNKSNHTASDLSVFEYHLSLLFPFVRPKGFIEFRSIDGLHHSMQMIPALLLSGLLYSDSAIEKTIETFFKRPIDLASLMRKAEYGLADDGMYANACQLFELAIDGLESLPTHIADDKGLKSLIEYFNLYTSQRRTPAHSFQMQQRGIVVNENSTK